MDELLMSRVKQLREIEEQIDRVVSQISDSRTYTVGLALLHQLHRDVQDMVRKAEAEHEAF